nr:hypothetical protein [Tanacetum cinerariifolium]
MPAFLYGTIEEEVYISQSPGFINPQFPNKVYKVKQSEEGIFISQDYYVAEILKKFDFSSVRTASIPIETHKPLVKDEEAADVDVYIYRSMIGFLMYLIASRPDIMYLKGQPKLGLWYPRDSPFDLEAYSDSYYARANLDRKSTIGEYVAAAKCFGQVLWIQNQMLDYGFNIMNIKIYIDNESTICIVKNPVYHTKTKHIKIRHHFIRDSYEKKLIQGRKNLKSHQKFQDINDLVDEGMNFVLDEVVDKTEEFNLDADTEVIVEDKGSGEKEGSTLETVSTTRPNISTARPDISAARPEVSTAEPINPLTTTTFFDDEDVTISDTLVKMKNQKAKEKGVAFKDTDDSARPI